MSNTAKNLRPQDTIRIKVTGMLTGETWVGEFKIWQALTHRQQIMRDRLIRESIGTGSGDSEEIARATALADLEVRIFSAPQWWDAQGRGADMIDNEVLQAVYKAALESENKFYTERFKSSEAAKAELQSAAAKLPEDHD